MTKRILRATVCAVGICVAAVGTAAAQSATSPQWAKDVTALAIAPDGTWGTATEPSVGEALGKAIAHCKSKYRHEIGCGHRSTLIREGWSLAMRCGQENIIVAEKTLQAAEQAAIDSELRLRRDYKPNMPPCVRVVSVDPDGRIIAPDVAHLLQFVVDRSR
jgi:hypothetical protein